MSEKSPDHVISIALGDASGVWIRKTEAGGDSHQWTLTHDTAGDLSRLLLDYLKRTAPQQIERSKMAILSYSSMHGWSWAKVGQLSPLGIYFTTEEAARKDLRAAGFYVVGLATGHSETPT